MKPKERRRGPRPYDTIESGSPRPFGDLRRKWTVYLHFRSAKGLADLLFFLGRILSGRRRLAADDQELLSIGRHGSEDVGPQRILTGQKLGQLLRIGFNRIELHAVAAIGRLLAEENAAGIGAP